ncbi:hypothetical protein GCM10011519_22670 [Marmoricola endophyticus]|uniref:DUF732 domain-containing protein n=1 Tax=Marmoricola endophyticus TaxID=2040280 RepID=A0A917BJB9_9ACTN|nr:hypothetical protein [Marmoricola endophyticus]GGF48152.1 hypothetical protein GCM10011519_22670 [Marmoricola endophyticus]
MKRLITACLAAVALLATGACGDGMSKDETTASANVAKVFAGPTPSAERKSVASCFGDTLVDEAGIDQLKADKVLDDDLKASSRVPQKLSERTAEAYGDGLVSCFDFAKLKKDIAKDSGASAAQVDAYVDCLDGISDADLKQSIVDQYTKGGKTQLAERVEATTKKCGKLLGT